MRKLIWYMLTSLDGYYEGPGHDINWHNVDAEYNDYAVPMLDETDLLLFGRTTYDLMAGYWPTAVDDPEVAGRMNRLAKVVFSRRLERADWQNTRLVKTDPAAEVARLKNEPGKPMVLLGSGILATYLAERGAINEYRIMVNPVFLGAGTPVMAGISRPPRLRLADTRRFASGNMLLVYRPA